METRLQAFSWRSPICTPLEGERKMRESASPSEGVEGLVEMETRLQAFLWRCPIYAPSEGERKMRERVSPSEGGTGQDRVKYYEKEKAAGKAALNVMQRAHSERSDQASLLGRVGRGGNFLRSLLRRIISAQH